MLEIAARVLAEWPGWLMLGLAFTGAGLLGQWRRGTAPTWARTCDLAVGAVMLTCLVALATEGRGCARAYECDCAANDPGCIERYCR